MDRGRRERSNFLYGTESLQFAIIMNLPLVVKALLEDVQDKPPDSRPGPRSIAPLVLASERGYIEIVEMLLAHENVDINMQNPSIETALSWATVKGQGAVVCLLQNHGANVGVVFPNESVLHCAVRMGYEGIARNLLEAAASMKSLNAFGESAIFAAISLDRGSFVAVNTPGRRLSSTIELLLKHGAIINRKDQDRTTPLHLAAAEASSAAVRTLLNLRADANAVGNEGFTPLIAAVTGVPIASTSTNEAIVRLKAIHRNSAKTLVSISSLIDERGANINDKDIEGRTLHFATDEILGFWDLDLLKCLLSHILDPYVKNKVGLTPLNFGAEQMKLTSPNDETRRLFFAVAIPMLE